METVIIYCKSTNIEEQEIGENESTLEMKKNPGFDAID